MGATLTSLSKGMERKVASFLENNIHMSNKPSLLLFLKVIPQVKLLSSSLQATTTSNAMVPKAEADILMHLLMFPVVAVHMFQDNTTQQLTKS